MLSCSTRAGCHGRTPCVAKRIRLQRSTISLPPVSWKLLRAQHVRVHRDTRLQFICCAQSRANFIANILSVAKAVSVLDLFVGSPEALFFRVESIVRLTTSTCAAFDWPSFEGGGQRFAIFCGHTRRALLDAELRISARRRRGWGWSPRVDRGCWRWRGSPRVDRGRWRWRWSPRVDWGWRGL